MKLKRAMSGLLAVMMTFACTACEYGIGNSSNDPSGNSSTDKVSATAVEFWTAPNTEKIMQDQYDIYSDIKGSDSIEISAVKNEYENAQLIMTASEDIASYDVSVSDLKQLDGKAVLDNENITIYNQKYLMVSRITTNEDVPTGMYPDALLEFPQAKKAKENYIEKGDNQGLWITVYVPVDAEAGLYVGEVTVTYGGNTHKTPMQVYVYDYVLSEEMHQQTSFSITWPYQQGELNDTYEVYEAYRDTLLDYRLSTEFWRHPKTQSDVEFFVEEACQYARNDKKPMIILPYQSGDEGFNKASMLEYLHAFIDRSVEDEYDYLAQCLVYFGMLIDEPNGNDPSKVAQVKKISENWNLMREELVEELRQDTEFMTSSIAENVIYSVSILQHVLVGDRNQEEFLDVDATWCPTVDYYYNNGKEMYDTQTIRWWYTMLVPKPPYPTYHIEDGLMSGRLLSWMQYEYGITGNLYWAVNDYLAGGSFETDAQYNVEDYYGMFMDGGAANGDGWLFYPGAKYGIEGPIPTIRLMSIRDGLEEYELLYDLGDRYEELSEVLGVTYDFNDYLNNYVQYLYTGVKVLTTPQIFISVRQALLNMCGLAKDNACFLLSYTEDGTYKLAAKENVVVKKADAQVSTMNKFSWNGETYKLYTIQITNSETEKITAEVDGRIVELNIEFIGENFRYTHDAIGSDWLETSSGAISDATYNEQDVYKVSFNTMESNKTQSFNLIDREVLDKLNAKAGKLTFNIYSEQEVKLSVRFKYENKAVLYEVATVNLKTGANEVSIGGLYAFDWTNFGKVEYIVFSFGEKGDQARTVYFGDITLSTVNF